VPRLSRRVAPRAIGAFALMLAAAADALIVFPPQNPTPLPLVAVAAGLELPVDIVHAGDGSGRLLVAEKPGRVRVVRDGALVAQPLLDIASLVLSGDERGLLGVAFHPRFATTRHLYVNYTRKPDGATVVARYRVPEATPDAADPASAQVLFVIAQPYANHNGGAVRFGPDGLLYVGMGDGGGANDPQNRAQDPQSLLGKILRIDVDGGSPYAIPPGNPYANGVGGRPEIWATGLRNPWKLAFDGTALYIGDVGQDQREELDAVTVGAGAGPNFGWRAAEGTRCTGLPGGPPCDSAALTPPIVEYTHDTGCSITGGEVYRGTALASTLGGRYVFGDFCTGAVYVLQQAVPPAYYAVYELGRTGFNVSAFGRDESGEVYVADMGGGRVMRLGPPDAPGTVPVVEYRHAGFDHYFITSAPDEIAGLDAGAFAGWQRTGAAFRAWPSAAAGRTPICRFYLPPGYGDSHFFSADAAECERVRVANPGFVLESEAAMHLAAPNPLSGDCADPATQPVYRIWNRRPDTNHRYTTSPTVRDAMVAAGGVAEGYGPGAVAMCAPR